MTRMPGGCASLGLATALALTLLLGAPSVAFAQPPPEVQSLIRDLRSPKRATRQDAAKELGRANNPNIFAVRPLLEAARVETHPGALADMLLPLGKSGMLEALGLIQTHAQSPIEHIAKHARRALKLWLVANGVMSMADPLPDPPHAYYRGPPAFPPHRPAGRPIAVWAGLEPPPLPGDIPKRPIYEGANPNGLPPGYRLGTEPRWPLVWAGLGTFGGLYLITNVVFGVSAAADDDEYDARLLIPVVGPLFPAAEAFEATGFLAGLSHAAGVLLVIDTLGQTTGLIVLLAGALSERPVLERAEGLRVGGVELELGLTPTGVGMVGSF